ncbi:MAG TPA: endolytic transglycosylase MltG [Gemmatimonadaceae bacterium]|nr:endolytic transglycosylase MltG [Gemmatimonadaceae bacterium]
MRKAVLAIGLASAIACGGGSGASARVVIPQGVTFRAAADSLRRAGLISSTRLFRIFATLTGKDRELKPGTYMLARNMSWGALIDALTEGRGMVNTFTLPEGYAIADMVPTISRATGVPAESLLKAVRDSSLLARVGGRGETLEGYLFPDTYTFPAGAPAPAIVASLVRRFQDIWKPEWNARLSELALTKHELVTLASIVEKEARRAEERPVIAAVYLNRLKRGMRLQADPTVQYAIGRHVDRVLYRHLEIDSRYNTYRYPGLPPGPIASPGAASLQASLYPANVPYLYFVAHPDGHHEFRTTFAEHAAAIRAVRKEARERALRERQADTTAKRR